MGLIDKLKKNSKIKDTSLISESKVYGNIELTPTPIPMLNVALSGEITGGFGGGITIFAGPSKHFKTLFGLVCAKSYMDKYEDAVMLMYDSEFGCPPEYFESMGIDLDRVVHTPITNIEDLKFDLVSQLENLDKKDKVVILIDSLGNLASKKELDDARDAKSVADMTRAKMMKGLFRMITPMIKIRDIPMFCVSHTYDTQEMFSRQIVSGGKGQYYSADTIFIIGRRQDKKGTEVVGYDFIINVEKSRFVREKSKIPISVHRENGISQYSGLLDVALEGGYAHSPTKGYFQPLNPETGEILDEKKYRKGETATKDFWMEVFAQTDFSNYIAEMYKVATGALISDQEFDIESEEEEED